MNSKKIIILIGTILTIKIKEAQDEIKKAEDMVHNYATNETTEIEEIETDSTVINTEDSTENTSEEPELPADYIYNVVDDVNANRDDLTDYNFSIDGKLVTLPCSYDYIVDIFGTLYETQGMMEFDVNPADYTNITNASFYARPETGTGLIEFTFTSDEPTELSKCMCTAVNISGISYEDTPLMTIALPGNIHWGSTTEDIFNVYGKVTDSYECDERDNFMIIYEKENGNTLSFFGSNGGLYQFSIEYATTTIE